MYVAYGRYRWAPRVVAFRNDYCLSCARERVAYRVRTFDALHLFWVPLIPLGFWKRWTCAACGSPPHQRVRTSKPMKVLGSMLLAFFAVAVWLVPVEAGEEALLWSFRAVVPFAAFAAFYFTLTERPEVGLREHLTRVSPSTATECPICGTPLGSNVDTMRCPECQVERVQL